MARHVWNALFGSAIADALVAGFAALAVAFVAWAMPDDIFSTLVSASGLARIVPAAAPPLGETARLITIVAAAGAIFALLFVALRLVSYRPPRSREVKARPLAPMVPRVRRADAHPDAPSRAPILAMAEFGTPIPPPWREPEEDEAMPFPPEAEPEPLPDFERDEPVAYDRDPEPWSKPRLAKAEPASTADWLAARAAKEPEELVLSVPIALPPPPEEPVEPVRPVPLLEQRVEPVRPVEPPREPRLPPRGNESLAELMQRLERGLARISGEPQAEPIEAPDERLRNAIEDLQRLAANR